MIETRIITFLTDFGLDDPYVAEMKAVILKICTGVIFVDISHGIEKYNIKMGAYALSRSAKFFPKGTIHLAIVDPGVGSARQPIIIEGNSAIFIGPDNGVLVQSAEQDGIKQVYTIKSSKFLSKKISNTFHGRDIFAQVAGYIAQGLKPSQLGSKVFSYKKTAISNPKLVRGKIIGELFYIDTFGNLATNIESKLFRKIGLKFNSKIRVILDGRSHEIKLLKTYSQVAKGDLLAVIGSGGFLEISANQGDASQILKAKTDMKIEIVPLI
ncbi:MAG: SAM-dependent chlorinase/fluorinase [Candidatus Bathyarchaeota archaeon]